MAFSDLTRTHLAEYKRAVLSVNEDGSWKGNGKPYLHILPYTSKELNILSSIRDGFWSAFPSMRIQLHKDFHHLNSSQALAFNLFYPAICGLDSGLLKELPIEGAMDEFCFEKVFDQQEGTNFDCYIKLKSGNQVFFEIKYSEQGFGGCIDDERHRRKLQEVYRKRLLTCIGEDCFDPAFFFKHYQLLRNISYLAGNGEDRLYLIFPRANEKLAYAAVWLDKNLTPATRSQVTIVYLEDLIADLLRKSRHEVWNEFSTKYVLPN